LIRIYEGLSFLILFYFFYVQLLTYFNTFTINYLLIIGDVLPDLEFELLENDETGTVVTKKYKGPWIIVDNGYLKWSTTVPPMKITANEKERRWSHWLESLRKDVECTFGILKGRWRVLKTGIRLQGLEVANNVWKTCCALHNWLLDIDGLDGEWDGALGQVGTNEIPPHIMPLAMQRLELGFDPQNYDMSGLGPGDDILGLEATMETVNNVERIDREVDGYRIVRYLSLKFFRDRLIEHFDIMFKRYQLVWPQHRPIINNPI